MLVESYLCRYFAWRMCAWSFLFSAGFRLFVFGQSFCGRAGHVVAMRPHRPDPQQEDGAVGHGARELNTRRTARQEECSHFEIQDSVRFAIFINFLGSSERLYGDMSLRGRQQNLRNGSSARDWKRGSARAHLQLPSYYSSQHLHTKKDKPHVVGGNFQICFVCKFWLHLSECISVVQRRRWLVLLGRCKPSTQHSQLL